MSMWNTLAPALPEMVLAIFGMALLMLGVFFRSRTSELVSTLAVLGLAVVWSCWCC